MDFNPLQREADAFKIVVGVIAAFVVAMILVLVIQAL
jgi:hypothetical protein